MLFGAKLQNEIYPPWKDYYIDYDGLKKMLKENVIVDGAQVWTVDDEKAFAAELDRELEKVYSFQVSKYKDIDSGISKLELITEKYLEELSAGKKPILDKQSFEKKLEELLAETNELDHFARLNFTGFSKIVKKHDNLHKGYSVKALLNVRMKSLPLNNISEDTSPYLYRISVLYSFLRDTVQDTSVSSSLSNSIRKLSTSGKLSSTPSAATSGKENFKVLKFWIHPDNLMETKTTILRHLPVLVYNSLIGDNDNEDYVSDPTITSLYFDNRSFELYNDKLLKQKTKNPSMRIRWTGKLKDNDEVTLENKTFDYETGDEDVIRLNLKPKYVNDFIFAGKHQKKQPHHTAIDPEEVPDDNLAEMYEDLGFPEAKEGRQPFTLQRYEQRLQRKGLPQSTIDRYANDYKNLQSFIQQHDLQPTMRSMFTRTAFQMPGDNRLRISIDSDILFVREDSFDPDRPIRDPDQWHRTDIDSNVANPFSLLRKGEYNKFPYSAMEIKVASSIFNNPNSKTLRWVSDLSNGHLVKEVPNFSKFIQGVSSLFLEDDNLDILPFWLPDLDSDIRKDPEQAYKDNRNKQQKQEKKDETLKNLRKKIGEAPRPLAKGGTSHLDYIIDGEDLDVDSSDEESSASNTTPATRISTEPSDPTKNSVEAVAEIEREESRRPSAIRAPPPLAVDPYADESRHPMKLASSKNFQQQHHDFKQTFMPMFATSKLEGYESEDEEVVLPTGVIKPSTLIRQSGPVKVEAKVWLANERTFIRWLHVTSLLTALTFSIVSSAEATHFPELAMGTAYIYFGLTLFSGCWAYAIYSKRLELIKMRSGTHLDGMFGPLVVGGALIVSLILEYYIGVKRYVSVKGIYATDPTTNAFVLDQPNEDAQNLPVIMQWMLRQMVKLVN